MIEQQAEGLRKIRRALLSVSDKTGIVELARELRGFGVEIISTGGTATALREAGIEVLEISDVTGFPEMMDGRVKTLHPRIHGALLALRDNAAHVAAMSEHDIEPIDLVVVNLYPFEQTVAREGVTLEEAVEQIDIGGPSMIRSAAKNYKDVAVVTDPQTYGLVLHELRKHDGSLSIELRLELTTAAFLRTAAYDNAIFHFFQDLEASEYPLETVPADTLFDATAFLLTKTSDLRYGENPHQKAALYQMKGPDVEEEIRGIGGAELLGGKEMSFNNYVDADAAWQLVCDFDELACAIIKHTNPAGVALGQSPAEAYRRALATDPVSAFGGIVAFNRSLDEEAARALTEIFTEVVIAPDFSEAALAALRAKKNLRVLRMGQPQRASDLEYRQITGGMLVQSRDAHLLMRDHLKVVTKRAPGEEEIRDLLFAWTVCKHTKSNAIVYARDGQTIGVGAGQMSRVDSVRLGAMRAQLPLKNSVIASDAFFPFRDGVDEAARQDITAVIQPGGSVRDGEVIAAADEHNLAMVFTGIRHFKH
ncbi:MAG TPA: bifunctional phosphoribosylaminoimidazolecarboxamide formyltransferase/IMP cyclohydrolase [Pyrinomonadaceae bacterium]|jgi:phosphoribosylaminoimidazolecarboxamide formyltransferase/IMP cyclohydrolase|nr:bifunctional phosphoribosylaminoimidazolecarboxamide formyltransferase/IMP cyclohydrolase [Pyrinomonadaceae bacterium]